MDNRKSLEKYGLYDSRFEHDSCGVGFVCNIKGNKSNEIIRQGLEVLKRLSHRGATGADPQTGDGAGILIQIPHEFFSKVAGIDKITLPEPGEYGTGLIFLPQEQNERRVCKEIFAKIIKTEELTLLGWRAVPLDDSGIGRSAKETQQFIEQIFIGEGKTKHTLKSEADGLGLERRLYVVRKQLENIIRASKLKQKSFFYITNLSRRTFLYKGLLMPEQLEGFFLDLKDEGIKSALCLVHSRYSTNTFPTWDLAQPFMFLAHNGEINTLRGNINWMRSRQSLLKCKALSKNLKKIFPVIVPGGSDSATIDNVFELLVLAGRSLPHAMMMLIPAAWEEDKQMEQELKDFYTYHACLMEPWDGPAAIAFTDGTRIGAVLDRNGLRPCRYLVTKKDFVVMASEVGVLDIPPEDILFSGRLKPGKFFFIDTEAGRLIEDEEIKLQISTRQKYSAWLKGNLLSLDKIKFRKKISGAGKSGGLSQDILTQLKSFGYTREDLKFIIKPMVENAQEPVGSMGNDTPHTFLSLKPQLLYNYFKQLFAQVTNPAIDPIREELVMSLFSFVGREKNLLAETPLHAHKLLIREPILSDEDLEKLKKIKEKGFKTKTISLLFRVDAKKDFMESLDRVCREAEEAIKEGYTFIILSDQGTNKDYAAMPSLLATGAVHHHLVRKALRTQIGIIVESA